MATKTQLRQQLRQIVRQMTAEERQRQSNQIADQVIQSSVFRRARNIGLYVSREELEVETRRIFEKSFDSEKSVFIPKCSENRKMIFLKVFSITDVLTLPKNKWKIREPEDDSKRPEVQSVGGLDLLIVPGVAFAMNGSRLGNGGGFYDTYLSEVGVDGRRAVVVGVAFKQQMVESVFNQIHDKKVDFVFHVK
ncbi:5-formyltetrahydrofolate cyclo-ligase-like [Oppia nitens]|uniref:5-formyltetrahydrofolate cyclo-ligase-like n=1 Tax=Oppia nitens TaxID=1686743 RepID=UPI0023DC6341|nr:5-formyltetrahydrofolate cyclo-ligase-like [Oppia nitens]